MPVPAVSVKGKSRKWLLYAAGAGVLLALIFLLRKKGPAAETSPGGTVVSPEGTPAGAGISGGGEGSSPAPAAPAAPSLNLGGPLNPGESVSGRAASAGGEVEASRAREAAENAGASPEQVKSAEEAAYHRGVAVVKKQDKEKAAAAKAKTVAAKAAPKPQKPKHKTTPKPTAKPHGGRSHTKPAPAAHHAHHAAPKPHKTRRK